jgi:hypothetical protein
MGGNLNSKRILHFYFNADGVERALNNLIEVNALRSQYFADGEICAEVLIQLIAEKNELSLLWVFVNEIITALPTHDRQLLERYAHMRCGISRLDDKERKDIRRALVKFVRRVRGKLDRYARTLAIIDKYYCLI